MILTFEVDKSGKSMDIHFDAEGRDQLISLLARCNEPGDHSHLLQMDVVSPEPGNLITMEQFDEGSTAIEEVVLWMMGADKEL